MFARLLRLKTITPKRLVEDLKADSVTAIDVTSLVSWNRAHVPGALHLDPYKYEENELPSDKSTMLVFYCSNPLCRKAPNAAKRAIKMGYDNVRVMPAGIKGWLRAGMPVESAEAANTNDFG